MRRQTITGKRRCMFRKLRPLGFVLAVMLLVVGCKSAFEVTGNEQPASLVSEKVDVGESIDDQDIFFDVGVHAVRDCTVKAIFVDCGCIQSLAKPEMDIPLKKGEVKAFPFKLAVGKQVGRRIKYVHFDVEADDGASSARLSCGIKYNVTPVPAVEPSDRKATRILGRRVYQFDGTMVSRRVKGEAPIEVDWAKTDLGLYRKCDSTLECFQYLNSDVMEDRTVFSIQTDEDAGSTKLKFVLTDASVVECVLLQQTVHPLETDLKSLFLGYIQDRSTKVERTIVVKNISDQKVVIKGVSFVGKGAVDCSCPIEVPAKAKVEMKLEFSPELTPGRRQGTLSLVPESEDISPIDIDVSWIIRGNS